MKRLPGAAAVLLATGTLFIACKKDPATINTGTLPDAPDAQMVVALNSTYLPAAKIDSAVALWEAAGTVQTLPFRIGDNKLTTDLANFVMSGSGTLTVQLFTQTKVNDLPLQWEKRFAYTLNRKAAVLLTAPVDLKDATWNPRAISNSQISAARATVIIALRPEDPFFELKEVGQNIAKRIEIVRNFYLNDTTNLMAGGIWVGQESDLNSRGGIVNRDYFNGLPAQLNGRAWNKTKIRASFYAALNPARIYEAEFVLDNP